MAVAELERRTGGACASDPVSQLTALEKHLSGIHAEISEALQAERVHLTSVQGLLIARLGQAEMEIGELQSRDAYLGSNVSYNVRKLVDLGFITTKRADCDGRTTLVRCTPSGLKVAGIVRAAVAVSHHLTNVRVIR